MRMPGVLDKVTLAEERRLDALTFRLDELLDGVSTATLTVEADDPIGVGAWMRMYTPQGDRGVYEVTAIDTDYITGLKTVTLKHCIRSLGDTVIFGEIKTRAISGGTAKATVRQALEYILGKQSLWVLGTCDFSGSYAYELNDINLTDALNYVLNSLPNHMVTYSMDEKPFTLNVIQKPTEPSCEMRLSRNLSGIKQTVDTSQMFTRMYPIGYNNLRLPDPKYVEKNTDIYGAIEHTETCGDINDRDQLRAWANSCLDVYAEPIVSVEANGIELSGATGESLDRLTVGTMCRVPLPEYGTTINEIITEVEWSDLISDKESVRVVIANTHRTVASVINKIRSGGRGGGRASAKAGNYWTKSIVTLDTNYGMLNGEVIDLTDFKETFEGSALWQTKDLITGVTGKFEVDGNDVKLLEGSTIKIKHDGIYSEVVAANGIASAINQTAQEVTISAAKINLNGYVTATQLSAAQAEIDNLKTGVTRASVLSATSMLCTNLSIGGTAVGMLNLTIDGKAHRLVGNF